MEMLSKLEQLAKRRNKDLFKLEASKTNAQDKLTRVPSRTKNPLHKKSLNHFVKKFSTVNLDSGGGGGATEMSQEEVGLKLKSINRSHVEKVVGLEEKYLLEEMELREKYLEQEFSAAEKSMCKSQANQLKSLESLYTKESSEVLKRIESEDKTQDGGKVENVSREDIQRERRERLVKKGVQEKGKLKELYDGRKKELEQAQDRRRVELREELSTRRNHIRADHKRRTEEIQSSLR